MLRAYPLQTAIKVDNQPPAPHLNYDALISNPRRYI